MTFYPDFWNHHKNGKRKKGSRFSGQLFRVFFEQNIFFLLFWVVHAPFSITIGKIQAPSKIPCTKRRKPIDPSARTPIFSYFLKWRVFVKPQPRQCLVVGLFAVIVVFVCSWIWKTYKKVLLSFDPNCIKGLVINRYSRDKPGTLAQKGGIEWPAGPELIFWIYEFETKTRLYYIEL